MTALRGHVSPALRLKIILILGFLAALGPLSIDMYLPAFAKIGEDFGVQVDRVELSLTSFFIGLSLGQLLYGTLSDRFGRKKPLFAGLAIYILASAGCAWATNIDQLIILRFLQALGACAGMVISRAIVRDLFEHRESAKIFSALLLVMGVAPILAPLVGGLVAAHSHWSMIFWICGIFATLALFGIFAFLPESKQDDPKVLLRSSFQTYAMILRDREFLRNALAGGFSQAAMFAYITASPNVFINFFEVPAENFGWVFGANAAGLIFMSQVNSRLMRHYQPEQVLRVSISVIAAMSILLLALAIMGASFWPTLIPLFIFISTLGVTFPNSTANALVSQGVRAGAASALIGTLQFICASVASAAVSFFHSVSAVPMSATIAACGVLSFAIYFGMPKRDLKAEVLT